MSFLPGGPFGLLNISIFQTHLCKAFRDVQLHKHIQTERQEYEAPRLDEQNLRKQVFWAKLMLAQMKQYFKRGKVHIPQLGWLQSLVLHRLHLLEGTCRIEVPGGINIQPTCQCFFLTDELSAVGPTPWC